MFPNASSHVNSIGRLHKMTKLDISGIDKLKIDLSDIPSHHLFDDSRLLKADYFENALTQSNKVVIADKCGGGKTLAAAEFMATNYKYSFLYVAERNDQLASMVKLLTEKHNVPVEDIIVYNKDTPKKEETRKQLQYYRIVLVTHARLTIDDPTSFCIYANPSSEYRSHFIIDESVCMASILRFPEFLVDGILGKANLSLGRQLSEYDVKKALTKIREPLIRLSQAPYKSQGIKYSEVSDFFDNKIRPEARLHLYELAFFQILLGNYSKGSPKYLDVLVPLAPHQAWGKLFQNILILDATARYTPFLYDGFDIVGRDFDFSSIDVKAKCFFDFRLTKTNLKKNLNSFLNQDMKYIETIIDSYGAKPYIVTFKEFESDIQSRLGKPVVHYGMTRGSNNYLDHDSVFLIGSYRLPPYYLKLASFLYPNMDADAIPLAHWIQETFRSRIRTGESVNVVSMGDEKTVKKFNEIIGNATISLCTASVASDSRETIEKALREETYKTRKAILKALNEKDSVDLRQIAREHTSRNIENARKAYRGLIATKPDVKHFTLLDGDTVRVKTTL
jgi:hypothetical protein